MSTFTGQGQLAIAFIQNGNAGASNRQAQLVRIQCLAQYFACSSWSTIYGNMLTTGITEVSATFVGPGSFTAILMVPLLGDNNGGVAVFFADSAGYYTYIEYQQADKFDGSGVAKIRCVSGVGAGARQAWSFPDATRINDYWAAAASGTNATLFLAQSSTYSVGMRQWAP